jgi:class 3 adenylate cyclase/lipopolysaccharide biosynthesis regulator YciM
MALSVINTLGQNTDSLISIWTNKSLDDTVRLRAINNLFLSLRKINPDSALMIAQQELSFAQKKGEKTWEATSLNNIGIAYYYQGDYSLAREFYFKYLEISLEIGNEEFIGKAYNNIGSIYYTQEDYDQAIFYLLKSLKIREKLNDKPKLLNLYYYIGGILIDQSEFEEALIYNQKALRLSQELGSVFFEGQLHHSIGLIHEMFSNYDSAIYHYEKSLDITILNNDSVGISFALDKIGVTYSIAGNYIEALEYHNRAIAVSMDVKDSVSLANNYLNLGNTYHSHGIYDAALSSYFECLRIREILDDPRGIIAVYNNIGTVYMSINDLDYAESSYLKGIDLCNEIGSTFETGDLNHNLGMIFQKRGNYSKAIEYGIQSMEFFQEMGNREKTAIAYYFLGNIYFDMNDLDRSLDYFHQAVEINTDINNPVQLSQSYNALGRVFVKKRQFTKAISYCQKSMDYVNEDLDILRDLYKCLYESYKGLRDTKNALKYYEEYILLEDSLEGKEVQRKMMRLEFQRKRREDSLVFESDKLKTEMLHRDEINKKTRQRNLMMYGSIGIILLSGGIWGRLQAIRRSKAKIKKEKDRAEDLLLNILPSETAEELKQNGYVEAKKFDQVTVLFTDFKEFTKLSENIEPEQLVKSIDFYYKEFDKITTAYGLEKIKTIGDSYMCAGGLPTINPAHPKNVVFAAKDMINFVKNEFNAKDDIIHFEIRIGIHSGPVVAGIVGIKKWQYDIWGDTVNIAARMETNSEPGKINISETTYYEVKDEIECTYRGEIEVKHRGNLKMYFVN